MNSWSRSAANAAPRCSPTVPHRPADRQDAAQAANAVARAEGNMGRHMRSDDVRELLLANLEHPRWDDVAERCLTCGNCTMVCPDLLLHVGRG